MVQVFSVLNKTTGKKDLVKAETKGQVTKFLANNFVIEKAGALDVAEIMANGGALQDATAVVEQAASSDAAAEPTAEPQGDAPAEAGTVDAAVPEASQDPVAGA